MLNDELILKLQDIIDLLSTVKDQLVSQDESLYKISNRVDRLCCSLERIENKINSESTND